MLLSQYLQNINHSLAANFGIQKSYSNDEVLAGDLINGKPDNNMPFVKEIGKKTGLTFISQKDDSEVCFINSDDVRPEFRLYFASIDLFNYICAILHSSAYREKYMAFVNIDFSLLPLPKDAATFWQLVALGTRLRSIYLLESRVVHQFMTGYLIDGDNIVSEVRYEDGKVYINETQYFDGVPVLVWTFYMADYQPAQKWLNDRRDRALSLDDILHYQKIIIAIAEIDKLLKEINAVVIE